MINYTAPAYRVGSHVTRLYDVTGSSELVLGSTGMFQIPIIFKLIQ